jgi:hypothetical protein
MDGSHRPRMVRRLPRAELSPWSPRRDSILYGEARPDFVCHLHAPPVRNRFDSLAETYFAMLMTEPEKASAPASTKLAGQLSDGVSSIPWFMTIYKRDDRHFDHEAQAEHETDFAQFQQYLQNVVGVVDGSASSSRGRRFEMAANHNVANLKDQREQRRVEPPR